MSDLTGNNSVQKYLYEAKPSLLTKSEQAFFDCIQKSVPAGYVVFPQANLATFIQRTDAFRYQNELYRNVDFLITDAEYKPMFAVEINDQTHLDNKRRVRDEKVKNICEEAGIPIIWLWTSYGVNPEYIQKRINETLASLPVARVHHFSPQETGTNTEETENIAVLPENPTKKRELDKRWISLGLVFAVISAFMTAFPLFSYYALHDKKLIYTYSTSKEVLIVFFIMAIVSLIIGILSLPAKEAGKKSRSILLTVLSSVGVLCGICLFFLI